MNDLQTIVSWDDLIASLETAAAHPTDTAWNIFRYMQKNYKTMGSQQARTLLATYMKLPVERPSLIHSCMLGIAVKVSAEYQDFRLPQFLQLWGYDKNLRSEDMQKQKGKDGKMFLALKERVDRQLQSYMLHHQENGAGEIDGVKTMYAVKVFETAVGGKRRYFAKLVAADGMELTADSHLFPCKPWEIQGRLYDVSLRKSQQGNYRAEEIVVSKRKLEDVFPTIVGYVEGVDEGHGHYHVYDPLSRHFVAEKPRMMLKTGDFVMFAPIIPAEDRFKSAAVIKVMPHDAGLETFGMYTANVSYVNKADGYFRYRITSPIAATSEGIVTEEGFASLVNVSDDALRCSLSVGDTVRLLLFLKRGKDGPKRNHVAEVLAEV